MLNALFFLVMYQSVFFIAKRLYKKYIEKKYNYIIPTKGFQMLVDRNITYYDEEVINNKKLSQEINYLFISELVAIFFMMAGAIYFILV